MRPATRFSAVARHIAGTISTDDILPARYKHATTDPVMMAAHVFETSNPGFAAKLKPSSVLVAGSLFGIGSSREQAVAALRAAGVAAVIAPAFGRIFFRNAWNLGLPAITIDRFVCEYDAEVTIDLVAGTVETGTRESSLVWRTTPLEPDVLNVYRDGGLLAHLRLRLTSEPQ